MRRMTGRRARAAAICVGIAAAAAIAVSSGCTNGELAVVASTGACATPIDLDALPVCDKAGWCATEPIGGGRPVAALHGAAPDDVWFAVGTALLHWDGTSSAVIYDAGTRGPIVDVLEAAPDDLWIVPPTDAAHRFVIRLRRGVAEDVPVPLTNVTSVAGTGPNDVWFGGQSGAAHWDGSTMTLVTRDVHEL